MFLVVVKTSLGIGQVVATETTELITEGLKVLKLWNPAWNPDKSAQELEAIQIIHPTTVRYICDFHRAQAIERWVAKASNGVNSEERRKITGDLKALAYTCSG